jgi:hypothetical protein
MHHHPIQDCAHATFSYATAVLAAWKLLHPLDLIFTSVFSCYQEVSWQKILFLGSALPVQGGPSSAPHVRSLWRACRAVVPTGPGKGEKAALVTRH